LVQSRSVAAAEADYELSVPQNRASRYSGRLKSGSG
jgi:hypothetical protein